MSRCPFVASLLPYEGIEPEAVMSFVEVTLGWAK
jgi:hypothetical protein